MPSVTTARMKVDRRVALKLMASAVAATMARCSPPDEEIIPYVDMPERLVAGVPMRFATTLALSGYGRGFLGISVDGRPIKIEGNPRHPFSLGATDVFAEAEVLSLYDPGRSSGVLRDGQIANWEVFATEWERVVGATAGSAIALVTGRIVSPTTLARVDALKARFPGLRWYRYEPVNDDAARAGAQLAFGRLVTAMPRWAEIDVVLALGADPLGHSADQLHTVRAFSSRRGTDHRQQIHVVEPAWTLTGAAADFRLALAPQLISEMGRLIANGLGANLGEAQLSELPRAFGERARRDLLSAPRRAVVLAGEGQPAELHALCHWINDQLHAPVDYLPSLDPIDASHEQQFLALADDLRAGRIVAVVIIDANPVYDAPDHLKIAQAVRSAPFSAQFGLYRDETAQCCHWHLPASHALESWGDARAPDGTASLAQPLIQRLHDTRTRDEVLALLANEPAKTAYDLIRETWRPMASGDFETWWRTALHDGVIGGTAETPVTVSAAQPPKLPVPKPAHGLTLVLSPDPAVWDGGFANNAWLQECPHPFTKQVWGNCAQLAPGDAAKLGITDEDTVEIELDGVTVTAPAIVMMGQAEGTVAASWGQGHSPSPLLGAGVGERYCGLGSHPLARVLSEAQLRKSAKFVPFRSTQSHTRLSGPTEELFQIATLIELTKAKHEPDTVPPSLLEVPRKGQYAWAMVVDTDACIGCNACVVACQAENNVPIVGPEEVSQGRDMHWLRVDAYARPQSGVIRRGFQPVPCMHCELAPCEPVCPVEASVHDHEGLNVQVYNRCIGTRFCEANCPYKVRRFNWFAYAGEQAYANLATALRAQHNPDVSVRGRGVMEKCNYCLQRISRARHAADREDRQIGEGEVVTACQAACPTRAIHFGDLNRKDSDVSRLRQAPQHYVLLEELNTRPRTTYLKRLYTGGDESS